MSINFPPGAPGATHSEAGINWTYDGEKWVSQSDGSLWKRTGSTLEPANAGDDVDLGNIKLFSTGNAQFDSGRVGINTPPSSEGRLNVNGTVVGKGLTVATNELDVVNTTTIKLNNDGSASFSQGALRLTTDGTIESERGFSFFRNGTQVGYAAYDPASNGLIVIRSQGADGTGGAGVQLSKGGTSWAAYSQRSLKTNLSPITDGLTKVSSLSAVTGRYKTDEEGTSRSFLIADEVQQVLPEAVSGKGTEEDPLSLRYTEVIPLLVSALHDAKDRIEALEAQLQGGSN